MAAPGRLHRLRLHQLSDEEMAVVLAMAIAAYEEDTGRHYDELNNGITVRKLRRAADKASSKHKHISETYSNLIWRTDMKNYTITVNGNVYNVTVEKARRSACS